MIPEPLPSEAPKKERLWNLNFFLLWQGQFVSAIGDIAYSIALGFWILDTTGSTAIMGTLMAVSSLPRVIVAPFAGVIVDRCDRKWLLVLMDTVRGIVIVLIAAAAFTGFIKVWMVFVAGVIVGLCGSFFNPAVLSIIPDITPKAKVVQANSIFNLIYTGSGIIGNSASGVLFKIFGAPLLFLLDGISYLFSAITEIFIKVPRIVHKTAGTQFFADLEQGFAFVWSFKGLRLIILLASILNFFANMGIMLILPLFEQNKHLGPALYGIFMTCFTAGLCLGFVLISVIAIRPARRFLIFAVCALINALAMIFIPVFLFFPVMAGLVFATGLANAVINSFIMGVTQLTIPQDKRGKVFGLMASIAGGMTPIAFALGGILAEFIPIRILIAGSFTMMFLSFTPLFINRAFKNYINFDPDTQTIEEIR